MAKVAITCDESGHGALIAGGCGTAFGDRVLAEIDLGKNLPRGLSRRVDSDRPPRRCPGFDPPLAKARSASATNNQISVVIKPWAPHHFRGLFSSITPHAAAAVIPPSAMSTKTSSGVPRVIIILATLVVLASCAARWRPPM